MKFNSKKVAAIKSKIVLLLSVVLLWAQPLTAGSSREGHEKHHRKESETQSKQARMGEMGPDSGQPSANPAAHEAQAETQILPQAHETASDVEISKPTPPKVNPLTSLRNSRRSTEAPRGESPVFGYLSFACGVIGLISLIGLFILPVFWPLMLIFSMMALIFGTVGISKLRKGRGWAIAGLALGIGVNLLMLIAYFVVIILLLDGDYSYW